MKPDIHPVYYSNTSVQCACGNAWSTGATVKELKLEICSNCHPFYTGTAKHLDARGRIDKFSKRNLKHKEAVKMIQPKKPRVKKNIEKSRA